MVVYTVLRAISQPYVHDEQRISQQIEIVLDDATTADPRRQDFISPLESAEGTLPSPLPPPSPSHASYDGTELNRYVYVSQPLERGFETLSHSLFENVPLVLSPATVDY
ncbi:unnamed protein product, partial [Heterotrigona itama]